LVTQSALKMRSGMSLAKLSSDFREVKMVTSCPSA
jgi:hypothetical protein